MKDKQGHPDFMEDIAPVLRQTGEFFRAILENLVRYFSERSSFKVKLPSLGTVAVEDLDLLFRILWRLLGRPDDEKLPIVLHAGRRVIFHMEVRSGSVIAFSRTREGSGGLEIDLKKLAAVPDRGAALLAIMRSEGITLDGEKLPWCKIARKARISSDALNLLNRWFFPISGTGFIFWLGDKALPFIYYGGPARLVSTGARKDENMIAFTQRFRHRHRLSLATSVKIDFLRECLCKDTDFLSLLSHYGQKWVISVPLEPNDLIFGDFYRFLPWRESCKRCNIDREHIAVLAREYLANTWKYLKLRPVYLTLKDHAQSLLLEVTLEGVCEIPRPKDLPTQDHFVVDLEMFSTFMAWSNHTSLRLVSDFLDETVPAEISEKFVHDDALVFLQVQDESGRMADLFISGGQHELPGYWDGDFCALLMSNSRRILFSESLQNAPLIVSDNDGLQRIHFPPMSTLASACLKFSPASEGKTACGIARLVSDTSLLADIVPGLRTTVLLSRVKREQQLAFAGKHYRIVSGSILLSKTRGRIVKRCGFEHTLYHAWITGDKGGYLSAMREFRESPMWSEFIASNGESLLDIGMEHAKEYLPPDVFLPHSIKEGVIEAKKVGWTEKNFQKMRFWVLKSWAVPFDKRGNFLVRVRALAEVSGKPGFALLEFPCHIPGILDRLHPLPLSVKKYGDSLRFISGANEILSISGDYLREQPGAWWHSLFS